MRLIDRTAPCVARPSHPRRCLGYLLGFLAPYKARTPVRTSNDVWDESRAGRIDLMQPSLSSRAGCQALLGSGAVESRTWTAAGVVGYSSCVCHRARVLTKRCGVVTVATLSFPFPSVLDIETEVSSTLVALYSL